MEPLVSLTRNYMQQYLILENRMSLEGSVLTGPLESMRAGKGVAFRQQLPRHKATDSKQDLHCVLCHGYTLRRHSCSGLKESQKSMPPSIAGTTT